MRVDHSGGAGHSLARLRTTCEQPSTASSPAFLKEKRNVSVFATCLGYPRIGVARELKRALESCWARRSSGGELLETALELRRRALLTMKGGGLDHIQSRHFARRHTRPH